MGRTQNHAPQTQNHIHQWSDLGSVFLKNDPLVIHGSEVKFPGHRFWSWLLLEQHNIGLKYALSVLIVLFCWIISMLVGFESHYYTNLPLLFAVMAVALLAAPRQAICLGLMLPLLADYYLVPELGKILTTWSDVTRFVVFILFSSSAVAIVYSLTEGFRSIFFAHQVADLAREEAERAKAAKSEFLANMSHEIRTPLNGIVGLIQLFASEPLSAKQKDYVKSIHSVSEQLITTINNILDFSKLDAGSLNPEDVVFDVREVISDTAGIFRPLADSKGLGFFVHTVAHGFFFFRGDAQRIRQILNNLLSNAVKFTSKGKVVFETEVRVLRPGAVAHLIFHISDTGIGIPQKARKHLFSNFFQAETSTARRFGGTGLGLAISKQLSDLMGGRIDVSSKIGEGTTFRVELPLPIASEEKIFTKNESPMAAQEKDSGFSRQRHLHSILIAEDNELNLQIAVSMLTNAGYKTEVARNGREVISSMAEDKFSLVLMDLQMPELDGYEAAKQLRLKGVRVPIIALTAHATTADRIRCLQSGMCDYLSKPFKQEQLVRLVDSWLFRVTPPPSECVDCGRLKQLKAIAVGDQEDLLPRLLVLYENDSQRFRKEFSALVFAENRSALLSRIHSFKSASANLGLRKVVSILEKMESPAVPFQSIRSWEKELNEELGRGLRQLKTLSEVSA